MFERIEERAGGGFVIRCTAAVSGHEVLFVLMIVTIHA